MSKPCLSFDEIVDLTDYTSPLKQLNVLHERGFVRAYIRRDRTVALEREHYNAVCRGEWRPEQKQAAASAVNVGFLKRA